MTARDTQSAITALDDLQKVLTPAALEALFFALRGIIARQTYPRLLVEDAMVDDEQVAVLRCPHCGEIVVDAVNDGYAALDVLDLAFRTTTIDAADFAARKIAVWYEGSGEWEGLVTSCGHCSESVSLPEGWTMDE